MSDTEEPILYNRAAAERLTELIAEYYPGDAGWRVLAKHLADRFVVSEATHEKRQEYNPKRKSKFTRAEEAAVVNGIAAIVADMPDNPLRLDRWGADVVISKLHLLHRGETSVRIEAEQAAAKAARQTELSARASAAVSEFLERQRGAP